MWWPWIPAVTSQSMVVTQEEFWAMAKGLLFSWGELKSLGFSNLEKRIKVQGSLRNLWGWDCPEAELDMIIHCFCSRKKLKKQQQSRTMKTNRVYSESWDALTKDFLSGKSWNGLKNFRDFKEECVFVCVCKVAVREVSLSSTVSIFSCYRSKIPSGKAPTKQL